jgi:cellulose synthase/poly-beta-1,6-N-acetylglucosamine synthase-like glycosyltransferase
MHAFASSLQNTTWTSYFVAVVVMYYFALWATARVRRLPPPVGDLRPLYVTVVPARNEELVIERTIRSLLSLEWPDHLVMVMNDNSDDATSQIAHAMSTTGDRLLVIDRDETVAGRGKGDVLNHAFALVNEMYQRGDARLHGRPASEIVLVVVDADGRLAPRTLQIVAPYFADDSVGQCQIGVKIENARSSLLARFQDMEFVGFCALVQSARDRIGSSGLGGNGQFTRLSALLSLNRAPWTLDSLTEDLDLGLALVTAGWITRFTADAHVYQQGLTAWRPLMRQRTRWIQGHYQCWRRIPALIGARKTKLTSRLDLITYLMLVVVVVVVGFNLVAMLLAATGQATITNNFLGFVPDGLGHQLLVGLFLFGPITAMVSVYQRNCDHPLRWWEVPAVSFLFTIYSYAWVGVTVRAWLRMVFRRKNWIKTPRVVTAS